MAIRVLILERHAFFGDALSSRLNDAKMDVVAVLSTGRETMAFLERDQPDVILIGLDLGDSRVNLMKRRPSKNDGLAIGRRILKRWPAANLILMSEWNEPEVVDGALIAGFRGYLSRVTPYAEFVTAIHEVVEGRTVFSNTLTDDDL